MGSSLEAHSPAAETLVVEFDEATAVLDISNAQPVLQSVPVTYQRPVVQVSTTSSKVIDVCLTNEHSEFRMVNTDYEKFLADDFCQHSGVQFEELGLHLHDQDYIEKIKELQVYLDTVTKIVRPGCSLEVLNVALSYMSSLVRILSVMASKPKPHASL